MAADDGVDVVDIDQLVDRAQRLADGEAGIAEHDLHFLAQDPARLIDLGGAEQSRGIHGRRPTIPAIPLRGCSMPTFTP